MLKCKIDNPCLKCTKSGASAIGADKEFQTGTVIGKKLNLKVSVLAGNCLFVLQFYGPVNPMGSCRARSRLPSHTFTGEA